MRRVSETLSKAPGVGGGVASPLAADALSKVEVSQAAGAGANISKIS